MRVPLGNDNIKMAILAGTVLLVGAAKSGYLGETFTAAHAPEPATASTALDKQSQPLEANGFIFE